MVKLWSGVDGADAPQSGSHLGDGHGIALPARPTAQVLQGAACTPGNACGRHEVTMEVVATK